MKTILHKIVYFKDAEGKITIDLYPRLPKYRRMSASTAYSRSCKRPRRGGMGYRYIPCWPRRSPSSSVTRRKIRRQPSAHAPWPCSGQICKKAAELCSAAFWCVARRYSPSLSSSGCSSSSVAMPSELKGLAAVGALDGAQVEHILVDGDGIAAAGR